MNAVVLAARAWIGTPYLHQASVRGAGCDCLGLLRGVWREVFGEEPEAVPPYSMDWAEPQGIEVLLGAARRHLVEKPVAEAAVGDVLVFRMKASAVAKHVGLMSAPAGFIHSYAGHGVVESALTDGWRRRIAGCFEFA
jgi:NlpC/P60 family putative phage cell wall peptidase